MNHASPQQNFAKLLVYLFALTTLVFSLPSPSHALTLCYRDDGSSWPVGPFGLIIHGSWAPCPPDTKWCNANTTTLPCPGPNKCKKDDKTSDCPLMCRAPDSNNKPLPGVFIPCAPEDPYNPYTKDICDQAGFKSTHYVCDPGTRKCTAGATVSCPQFGCVSGVCSPGPSDSSDGCYIELTFQEQKSSDALHPSSFTLQGTKTYLGRGLRKSRMLDAAETDDDAPMQLIARDSAGKTLYRVEIPSARFITDTPNPLSGDNEVTSATNVAYLPYDNREKTFALRVYGQESPVTVDVSKFICGEPCIVPGDTGRTGVQVCCPPGVTGPGPLAGYFSCAMPAPTSSPTPTPIR